jgi:uncharacterized membrane protein YhaH (DUF805 family)
MTNLPPPPPAGYGGPGAVQPQLPQPLISYWKKVVLENYANFTGRARRAEFWWYFLASFLINVVLNILDAILGLGMGGGIGVLSGIYGLAVLVPGLAVGVRRLHDTDKSGWWLLIGLIPIVGIIVLIVFWAAEGPPGTNQYGTNPKYA